ncbi:hypothetical protein KY290_025000 [Solanum tuberosum]|uniref:DUF4283 domain-containing protein n=1 Tax=Solanum tuberosum TaxID=4113 RepID=A0ABQ7USB9_SOLTU|nr:hypothetical protein KY284_023856 [Solanum tuberosum]KAH0754730.1 hypothetical protein KY290_025000 [Solanum tuberosum]
MRTINCRNRCKAMVRVREVQNKQGELQTGKSPTPYANAIVNLSTAPQLQYNASAAQNSGKGNGETSGHHQPNGSITSRGVENLQQNEFPQISNNFTKYNPQAQQSKQIQQDQVPPKEPNNHNVHQHPKKDVIQEPDPYTVVQSFAARLRFNKDKNTTPVTFETPKVITKQGKPDVIFSEDDFMTNWATDCRFTLIGKFSNTMPNVELLRKNFITQTQLSGRVKIAQYNCRHVYIDLDNELDYITV